MVSTVKNFHEKLFPENSRIDPFKVTPARDNQEYGIIKVECLQRCFDSAKVDLTQNTVAGGEDFINSL